MKTYKNLYPRIWAYENLYEAWRNAARGKRKARGVVAFEYALTDRLLELEEELRTQTYCPVPIGIFALPCLNHGASARRPPGITSYTTP